MKQKHFFCLATVVLLLLGSALLIWGTPPYNAYHRPKPLMDFVPQDQGIYDTIYENFTESDCRDCHGAVTGALHRLTGPGLAGECSLPECHGTGPPPPGTTGSCVVPSCHGVGEDAQRHHGSDLAASGQCTACHKPNLVGRLRAEAPMVYYPNNLSPTPFSCQNCHWEDATKVTPPGFRLWDLHHMDLVGDVYYNCFDCHAMATPDPDWDSTNPLLIRFCANCHTAAILHRIHEGDTDGWEAVGFHVPPWNADPTDLEPDTYRQFTSAEKCVACHGGTPSGQPVLVPEVPVIDHISPHYGNGQTIEIWGTGFGSSGPGSSIIFTPRAGNTSNPVIIVSRDPRVGAWTNGYIDVSLYGSAPAGNYDTHVETATGESNRVLFSLTGTGSAPPVPGTPAITTISPTVGTDDMLVTIEGSNFGDRHCCDREVYFKLEGSPNDPTAMPVFSWTDSKVVVRLLPWSLPIPTPGLYSVSVSNESGYSNLVSFTHRPPLSRTNLTRDGLALTISGVDAGFGDLQSEVFGDNYGYSSQVKIGDRDHTYTATHITSWTATQIDLILDSFVDEIGSPVSELYGNFGLLVETKYFYDINTNGQLDLADQVYQTVTSTLAELELPMIQCEIVPDSTAVPRGGTLGFDITVTNNTDEVQVFGFATYATKPGGGKYPPSGYLIGPARVSLNPYGSRSAHRSHPIPGNTPLGTYTYYGVVGTPGAGLYHQCQFDFEVVEP